MRCEQGRPPVAPTRIVTTGLVLQRQLPIQIIRISSLLPRIDGDKTTSLALTKQSSRPTAVVESGGRPTAHAAGEKLDIAVTHLCKLARRKDSIAAHRRRSEQLPGRDLGIAPAA